MIDFSFTYVFDGISYTNRSVLILYVYIYLHENELTAEVEVEGLYSLHEILDASKIIGVKSGSFSQVLRY